MSVLDMQPVETVKIKSEHFEGGLVINKTDFDAETMVLFDEPEVPAGGDAAPDGNVKTPRSRR